MIILKFISNVRYFILWNEFSWLRIVAKQGSYFTYESDVQVTVYRNKFL